MGVVFDDKKKKNSTILKTDPFKIRLYRRKQLGTILPYIYCVCSSASLIMLTDFCTCFSQIVCSIVAIITIINSISKCCSTIKLSKFRYIAIVELAFIENVCYYCSRVIHGSITKQNRSRLKLL